MYTTRIERGPLGTVIRIGSALETIPTLPMPLSRSQREDMEKILLLEGEEMARNHRVERRGDVIAAESREADVQSRLAQSRISLHRTRDSLMAAPPGDLIRTIILWLAALVCFGAEFWLTYGTLPFILDIADPFTRVVVALAPATALLALEVAVVRLVEKPWRRLRRAARATVMRRLAAIAAMGVFLLALIAVNLMMVWYLADAREEAGRLQDQLAQRTEVLGGAVDSGSTEPTLDLDRSILNSTVRFVSLAVVLDGALFFVLAFASTRTIRRRLRLRREVRDLSRQCDSLEEANRDARGKLAALQEEWAHMDRGQAMIVEGYVARGKVALDTVDAEWRAARTPKELADVVLRVAGHGGIPSTEGN